MGSLASPVQDAAGAPWGHGVLLAGGLTAADVSRSDLRLVSAGKDVAQGTLPTPRHDAAAATLGGAVYVFGGGTGRAQLDAVVRVDPATGATHAAGRLPAASSDQAAAVVGGTAYVVGGYTGRRWLGTVVAWRRGSGARVVAHLPVPLRYAAVAAAGGRVVIAGGSTPAGASDRVMTFDPRTSRLRTVGRLAAPTTHAAAAALGGTVFVIGGRGALPDTPTDRILAVDSSTGRVRPAGRLTRAASDLAAVAVAGRILLLGGRSNGLAQAGIGALSPGAGAARPPVPAGNVYAADAAGRLSPAVRGVRYRIYVPNSQSDTVDVIDPRTYRVVSHFATDGLPQHVVPSWDLRRLYVTNDTGNSLTPIDPRTSRPGRPVAVDDPYNMYYTPDGRFAVVVAERQARLDFRDPHTFALRHQLAVPCRGVDHLDYSADGRYLLASCEFSGQLLKVDVARQRVAGTLTLPGPAMPQDVKLAPDGGLFYVADNARGGLWEVDGDRLRVVGFLATGRGAHGLYPSRDARLLYVSNRAEGSVSVVSFARRRVVATWRIPGGGSPDMGGVSPDGRVLWLTGRYSGEVYAIDTRAGRLLARIPVGRGPHGASVWPQPGRYSLGHTGILR